MTLGDRKIQIKIGTQELKEAFSEIEKILDGSSEKKATFYLMFISIKGMVPHR